jgi:bifunctional DNA-binding transcriptional regulator/antitoxin component of YhaV-PrlF toxin-antitoxin module
MKKGALRMPDSATLSEKFQISIPKSVRVAQGYVAGQKFAFVQRPSGLMLVPIPSLEALRGSAKGARAGDYRDRDDRF